MGKIKLFILFIFIFSSFQLQSKVIIDTVKSDADDRIKFGLLGGYNRNYNFSDFRQLPGVNYFAPKFNTAGGEGYRLGLFFETALLKVPKISLISRVYFSHDNANFTNTIISNEFIDNTEHVAEVNYQINTSLEKLNLENLLSFRLIKNFNLLAGFNIGFFSGSNFDQKESLVDPPTGNFTNGSRTRHPVNGEIQNLSSVQSAVSVGLNYDFKIGSKEQFIISPEILYSYSVSQVTTSINWKYHTLNFNIALKYSPAPSDKISDYREEIKYDTLQIATDSVNISYYKIGEEFITRDTNKVKNYTTFYTKKVRTDTLFIPEVFDIPELQVTYDDNGKTTDLKKISYEEYLLYNQKPLLSYVFFDSLSSNIPIRYKKFDENQVRNFNPKELFNSNTLDSYLNVLNIIGYRLTQNQSAKITVTGSNSNFGGERNNPNLSQKRAESVSNYLIKNWNIDKSRITVKSRLLPENPSKMAEEDGISENRRVEIISDNFEITKFLGIIDTVRKIFPENITVNLTNTNKQSTYFIDLMTDKNQRFPYEIENPISIKLDNPKFKEMDSIWISSSSMLNGKRNYKTKTIAIPIEKSLNNFISEKSQPQVEVYNLFLFSYNSYKLKEEHKQILNKIRERRKEFKSVKIYGYTDRIGDEVFNQNLSLQRAQEVADYLNFPNTEVKGLGESKLLYDNSNPEGRFYSRTVIIELEKYK